MQKIITHTVNVGGITLRAVGILPVRRLKRLLPNGIPRWIHVYDNGGETVDRYAVVFTGKYKGRQGCDVLGMSGSPFHPQGFCMHNNYDIVIDRQNNQWAPAIGRKNHLGMRIKFEDLPEDCQKAVMTDYKEMWNL